MAQHDFNIANQGFPATRSDINNALAALASTSSGTSEPSTTYANQFWYDTTNNLLKFRNEADSAWITLAYLDQGTNEWEIRSAVIQAVDSAGITLKTDDGTARVVIQDDGDVAFNTDTLFVDAANDRVGVGTSPSSRFHIEQAADGNGLRMSYATRGSGHAKMHLTGTTNDGVVFTQHNGSNEHTLYFTTRDTHQFNIQNSAKVEIDSDGIKFNGDTASANALNDYEEGSFDPTMIISGATFTYSYATGRYTKIGRVCIVEGALGLASRSGGSGDVFIGGLPFTMTGDSPAISANFGLLVDNLDADLRTVTAQFNAGQSNFRLIHGSGSTGAHAAMSGSSISGNENIRFQFSYVV